MDCTTLISFRTDVYRCLTRAEAALFDLADALLTDPTAQSFVDLSQAPAFRRQWPSVYAAMRDGQIDRAALRRVFVAYLPAPAPGQRLLVGIDASAIRRPDAVTSADRTLVYWPNLPPDATPVAPGWSFSAVVVLPQPVSSWPYVLDHQRIASNDTAITVGAAQLVAIVPLLPVRPLILLDRRYSCWAWVRATAGLATDQQIRARRDQVLYRDPPPRTGQRGRPRLDGARFQGSDPTTHGPPDAQWTGTDARGRPMALTCWHGLHLRQARPVRITVIRVVRAAAAGSKRDPRESWFWWLGAPLPPLAEVATYYGHRFGQEHGYRVDKQALLWAAPHLRTPDQFQRWTDVVAIVRNELRLARPLVAAMRRPWESPHRSITPQQVRRAMARLMAQVGTPAPAPLPRGKAPGRAKGATIKPATRHPVIIKGTKPSRSTKKTTKKTHVQRE
jgi:DDE superfamily endonuclease